MEFIKRKVFLTRDLKPLDTNGDGIFNALVLSTTTKTIQVPLRHSFDDMGIFEVSNEESFEIIDIGGIFDESITGITQPTGSVSAATTNWSGGGDSGNGGTSDTIIKYCDDLTAINGTSLTYGGTTATLTPNNSSATSYTSPLPTFTVDKSLCTYEPAVGVGDGAGSGTSDNVSDMFCLRSSDGHGDPGHLSTSTSPNVNGCNSSWYNNSPWNVKTSWSSYKSTAQSKALAKCQSMGYTSLMVDGDFVAGSNTIPQGSPTGSNYDCCTNPPPPPNQPCCNPWASVKEENHVSGSCCFARDGDGNCTDSRVGHYYRFCFFCKK